MAPISEFVRNFATSPLGTFEREKPWDLTSRSELIVDGLLASIGEGFDCQGNIAVHRSCTVEAGAVLKGPLIIGPDCFIAAGAYLRGGCWLEQGNIIGPSCELKSSFIFAGTKLAHFNFVGDSILGSRVNLEAGSIIANYRNEWRDPLISFQFRGEVFKTDATKFGALVGDNARIGANAVVAPGAIIEADSVVPRLGLIDQGVKRAQDE